MKTVFEISRPGASLCLLDECTTASVAIPEELSRKTAPKLPELDEIDITRHYSALARRVYGVNNGFYPLGSCTMKYNPRINEEIASDGGFTGIHPLQNPKTAQGCLQVIYETQRCLAEILGMSGVTLQPAAGAHGEFTGLLLIKAYHASRKDTARNKIIVPDSAHGTNPASASMAGFTIVNIPSAPDGCVDIEKLKAAVGDDTAGLMLTNPNTVGIFDKNILEITRIVHDAGGLNYYDGANLNAIMGKARPGDMGFDCVHVNLHKTFSTPHGGGGPGSGPVGCKDFLEKFLPDSIAVKNGDSYEFDRPSESIGRVKNFFGNFLVAVKALTYIKTLGAEGIPMAAEYAVLNANYLKKKLSEYYTMAYEGLCMHEFVMTLQPQKDEYGISAMDIAKSLLDRGIHPPTMYFPLIVHEALMLEPTETESKETLDEAAEIFASLIEEVKNCPEKLHTAPHTTVVGRPDEVNAARNPVLREIL